MTTRAHGVAAALALALSCGAGTGLAATPWTRQVVEEYGPPRPDWLASRRGRADMRAATQFAATLPRPDTTRVACDPTCAPVELRATDGVLTTTTNTDVGAKQAFARLPLAGELASPKDLHLVAVTPRDGNFEYSYTRGDGPVACDCAVTVVIRNDGAVVSAAGRRLVGYGVLPREPRYTRGEAFLSAVRQLVAESPILTDPRGLEAPELSALIVVPVGDRAALAHRFALMLDRRPYVVDVEDATLTVVRVTPDRRFDRVSSMVHEVPIVETIMPANWTTRE